MVLRDQLDVNFGLTIWISQAQAWRRNSHLNILSIYYTSTYLTNTRRKSMRLATRKYSAVLLVFLHVFIAK